MNIGKSSLFSQLLSEVDRNGFARLVRQTGSEDRSKGFSSWDHFVAMLFCQLAQAKSLREIDSGLRSCEGKLRHLGMKDAPGRSTLSYANLKRPSELFEKLFYDVLARVSQGAPKKKFRFKSKLYSLDSTVIELCASMFDWAKFRANKGAAKLHLLLDHDGCLPCPDLDSIDCYAINQIPSVQKPDRLGAIQSRGIASLESFYPQRLVGVGQRTVCTEPSSP